MKQSVICSYKGKESPIKEKPADEVSEDGINHAQKDGKDAESEDEFEYGVGDLSSRAMRISSNPLENDPEFIRNMLDFNQLNSHKYAPQLDNIKIRKMF